MVNASPIPSSVRKTDAVALLHDRQFSLLFPSPLPFRFCILQSRSTTPEIVQLYFLFSFHIVLYICRDYHRSFGTDSTAISEDEFFLLCDPHYASHKTLPQPPETEKNPSNIDAARKHFKLPSSLAPLPPSTTHDDDGTDGPRPVVKLYEVVDHMPNPVWSSNVVSREEFVDHGAGTWVRIRSPMSVVMETNWTVREKEGNGDGDSGLELVEDVEINCSRLVMGIVKGQVENNWKGIHKLIIDKLVQDAENKTTDSPTAAE
jgi:hypothetical protein